MSGPRFSAPSPIPKARRVRAIRCSPLRRTGNVSPPGCGRRPSLTVHCPRPWGSARLPRGRTRVSLGDNRRPSPRREGVCQVRARLNVDFGRVAPARQTGQLTQSRGITSVDNRMRSEHRQFLGRDYFRHVLPSAELQPVHAPIVEGSETSWPADYGCGPGFFLPWALSGILVAWVFADQGRLTRGPGRRRWSSLATAEVRRTAQGRPSPAAPDDGRRLRCDPSEPQPTTVSHDGGWANRPRTHVFRCTPTGLSHADR